MQNGQLFSIFRHFDLSDEESEIAFQLSLSSLIDCLSLFGSQSGSCPVLCIKCDEPETLKLWLEDAGTIVEIRAQTRRVDDHAVDFGFSNSDIQCKVILRHVG